MELFVVDIFCRHLVQEVRNGILAKLEAQQTT